MVDDVRALKGLSERVRVANVSLDEGVCRQGLDGGVLIQSNDGVAAGGERVHQRGSDEPTGAGDGDTLHTSVHPSPFGVLNEAALYS